MYKVATGPIVVKHHCLVCVCIYRMCVCEPVCVPVWVRVYHIHTFICEIHAFAHVWVCARVQSAWLYNCVCMCMCVYGNRITPGTGRGHKLVQNGGGSQQGMELSWA